MTSRTLLVVFLLTAGAPLAGAQDINGEWQMTFVWLSGESVLCEYEGVLEFDQEANPGALEGSGALVGVPCGEELAGDISGTIDGSAVSFLFPAGGPAEALVTGTVDGDVMEGTWSASVAPAGGTWTASRVSPPEPPEVIPTLPPTTLILLIVGVLVVAGTLSRR